MTDARDLGAVAARYWWVLLVRGLLLIALGIMMIAWTEATLVVLLVLFGAYLIVDGVMSLGEGMAERRAGRSSGGFLFQGVLAVVVGIAVIVWPEAAVSVGIWVLAFWAILAGIVGIAGGLGLRKQPNSGWGWFLGWGILLTVLGIGLLFNPLAGAHTLVVLVALWAIIAGLVLAIASFFVRKAGRTLASA